MRPAPHSPGYPPHTTDPHSHSSHLPAPALAAPVPSNHTSQHLISVAQLVRHDDPRTPPAHWPPHVHHHNHHHPLPSHQQHLSPPRRARSPHLHPRSAWPPPSHKDHPPSPSVVPLSTPASVTVPPPASVLSDPPPPPSASPPPPPPPAPPLPPDRDIKRYAKLLTPFIYKLYSLVSDQTTKNLCEWAPSGTSFVVHDPVVFSAQVLPLYFKHNQFSSFVRQLNKYSFHKLAPGACVFGHTHFIQNRPDLLLHIGPPRPQERGVEKNRHTAAAGGASLSSLQPPQPAAADPDVEVPDRLYRGPPQHHFRVEDRIPPLEPGPPVVVDRFPATYEVGAPRGDAGRPAFGGERAAVALDRPAVEDVCRSVQRGFVQDVNHDFSIAKGERDTLLRRLCAVERRNEDLLQGLLAADHRIEQLERANQEFGIRKRRSEYGDPTGSSKRLRGPDERGGGY